MTFRISNRVHAYVVASFESWVSTEIITPVRSWLYAHERFTPCL